MKPRVALAALTLLAAGAAGAQQVDGQKLAASKACMACHQVDSKRVGPPLRSVSERYAGQPEALEYLANKIRGGGRGAWGAVPMPAQTHVSEQDARQLAEWVLSLAPAKP
nr:c-type cytochrome [Bordetella genomosp. 13]